jgi:serine/threonine-protein phosphatase 2A activator
MRKLQTLYWLEPAGSHGVWGLDDYHFLPFLWGAHQLIGRTYAEMNQVTFHEGHKFIRPRSVTSKEVLEGYSHDFIYLGCISFINSVCKKLVIWEQNDCIIR